ncbi:MAG: hypothetical protein WCA46_09495 [Actinocatenispora sp.]
MDRDAEVLDLVCGPASPLPETHQRYRLVQHIATGGQAEVYRAVRLSGGISSAPVTVKVFRLNNSRPRSDQLRSWDKGDAVLMDLNSRGVAGICRRADGFYGPQPHPPGRKPKGEAEPYQVLDYLHGANLRDYVQTRLRGAAADDDDPTQQNNRLDAVGTLDTLVRVLLALHHPTEPGASPVVHMDIKPSNVMVLPNGDVRLIDFTGARYYRRDHMTTIAYTREAGGPEAFSGQVGPAYDVHGFGAVAYFMVTGVFPRTESPGHLQGPADQPMPPWAVLRRHPVLDAQPALRDHLLAPLADRPEDRPGTEELTAWTARLADLVERSDTPDAGLFWGVSRSARVVGRAGVRPTQVAAASGDGAWNRIERLEQEVMELRSALNQPSEPTGEDTVRSAPAAAGNGSRPGGPQAAGNGSGPAAVPADAPLWPDPVDQQTVRSQTVEPVHTPTRKSPHPPHWGQPAHANGDDPTGSTRRTVPDRTRVGGPVAGQPHEAAGTRVMAGGAQVPAVARPELRGVAAVPQQAPRRGDYEEPPGPDQHEPRRPLPGASMDTLRRGMGISMTGAMFSFVCWGIWAIANRNASFVSNLLMFVFVLAIAVGLFALCRLTGRLVIEGLMHRSRSSARLSHLAVGIYLVATGVSFASRVQWITTAYTWIRHHVS